MSEPDAHRRDEADAELVRALVGSARATVMPKPRLVALSNAIHRTFASSYALELTRDAHPLGLVVAFFQRPSYLAAEAARFEALGSLGVTTLVGFPGEPDELPDGVYHVDLTGRGELEDAWVLATFAGGFGATIVAVDDGGLSPGLTLEASRRFVARWTIDRKEAEDGLRQVLQPLRSRLERRVLALIEEALMSSGRSQPPTASWPLTLAAELLAHFSEPEPTDRRDEPARRDLLTGLYSRAFLDSYLEGPGESSARVAAVLVDLDDLGELNERRGKEAGDAALVGAANALLAECRPGDVLVREGPDELLLLAPVGGKKQALALARRLVVAVRAARLEHPYGNETVTATAAAALCDPAVLPREALYSALSNAKALGKDLAVLVE